MSLSNNQQYLIVIVVAGVTSFVLSSIGLASVIAGGALSVIGTVIAYANLSI